MTVWAGLLTPGGLVRACGAPSPAMRSGLAGPRAPSHLRRRGFLSWGPWLTAHLHLETHMSSADTAPPHPPHQSEASTGASGLGRAAGGGEGALAPTPGRQ